MNKTVFVPLEPLIKNGIDGNLHIITKLGLADSQTLNKHIQWMDKPVHMPHYDKFLLSVARKLLADCQAGQINKLYRFVRRKNGQVQIHANPVRLITIDTEQIKEEPYIPLPEDVVACEENCSLVVVDLENSSIKRAFDLCYSCLGHQVKKLLAFAAATFLNTSNYRPAIAFQGNLETAWLYAQVCAMLISLKKQIRPMHYGNTFDLVEVVRTTRTPIIYLNEDAKSFFSEFPFAIKVTKNKEEYACFYPDAYPIFVSEKNGKFNENNIFWMEVESWDLNKVLETLSKIYDNFTYTFQMLMNNSTLMRNLVLKIVQSGLQSETNGQQGHTVGEFMKVGMQALDRLENLLEA